MQHEQPFIFENVPQYNVSTVPTIDYLQFSSGLKLKVQDENGEKIYDASVSEFIQDFNKIKQEITRLKREIDELRNELKLWKDV